jgi:hypothetical protein
MAALAARTVAWLTEWLTGKIPTAVLAAPQQTAAARTARAHLAGRRELKLFVMMGQDLSSLLLGRVLSLAPLSRY